MFLAQLVAPNVISSEFGTITLTHEGIEIIVSVLAGGFVKATIWQGVMKPGTVTIEDPVPDPVFVPYEPTRIERVIVKEALRPLRVAKGGKSANDFKISDIYNLIFKGIVP